MGDIAKALSGAVSGSKTYAVMVGLIAYCIIQMVNKQPVDEAIVYSLLGAGGMTMRAGIAKATPKG